MNPRWGWAMAVSLALHTGAAVGSLGWLGGSPTLEVTAGEARVALITLSPAPHPLPKPTWNPTPTPTKPRNEPAAALPETEGARSTHPQSLHNPAPPYPPEAFRHGIQGVTALLVHVDPRGFPTQLTIERSSGSWILDEAALEAVSRWSFQPARRGGVPVPGSLRIRIRFQIVEARESA
jgi:protein TonB